MLSCGVFLYLILTWLMTNQLLKLWHVFSKVIQPFEALRISKSLFIFTNGVHNNATKVSVINKKIKVQKKCFTKRSWKLTVVLRCDLLVLVVPHHHWHRWTNDIADHLRRLTVAELLRWLNIPERQPLWKMEMDPQLGKAISGSSSHQKE